MGLVLLALACARSFAQLSITFDVDQAQAVEVLGSEERVGKMRGALDLVKVALETALSQSTASVVVKVEWGTLTGGAAVGDASDIARVYNWPVVRDKLINIATDAGEPNSELQLYQALPPSEIRFRWDASDTTDRTAPFVRLKYVQAQQLRLDPMQPTQAENTLRFRREGPIVVGGQTHQLNWQFWTGPGKPGTVRFSATAFHEMCHLLGAQSVGDDGAPTSRVWLMDVYSIADSSLPATDEWVGSGTRELRPTVDHSLVTRLNAALGSGAFPMSRGLRQGGDGFQTSHFRAVSRLTPPAAPIGLMSPQTINNGPDLNGASITKADWTMLDILGWVVDPDNSPIIITNAPLPVQIQPAANASLRTSRPRFEWIDNTPNSSSFVINVFRGDPNTAYIEPSSFGTAEQPSGRGD